jgi:sensor histidine kinase YesM
MSNDLAAIKMSAPAATKSVTSRWTVLYWALQLFVWGFYCWWQTSGEIIFASVPWNKAFGVWGSVCITGFVLTHLLHTRSKRNSWVSLPSSTLIGRLLLSAFVLSLVGLTVMVASSAIAYGAAEPAMLQIFYRRLPIWNQVFNEFLNILCIYVTWVAAYFGAATIRYRYEVELKQAKLAEALQAAELQLLESQLNPHFLFNALNGVRALIAEEPARAQDAVTQLARTLRYTLQAGRQQLVSLGRELEMVEDYLALESLRLAQRLQVVREVEPAATGVRIPTMLLQTLVENAIKHGIAPLREGGTLRIEAHVAAEELVIRVINPHAVILHSANRATQQSLEGVGLKNSARRLRLLFGARANLDVDLSDPTEAVATVRLPV